MYLRAELARKAAEERYFSDHKAEKRLLPMSVNTFLIAFGTTFVWVSATSDNTTGSRAVTLLGFAIQIACVITFAIIGFRKRNLVFAAVQEVWSTNWLGIEQSNVIGAP